MSFVVKSICRIGMKIFNEKCVTVLAGLMKTIAVKNLLNRPIGTFQNQCTVIVYIDRFTGKNITGRHHPNLTIQCHRIRFPFLNNPIILRGLHSLLEGIQITRNNLLYRNLDEED